MRIQRNKAMRNQDVGVVTFPLHGSRFKERSLGCSKQGFSGKALHLYHIPSKVLSNYEGWKNKQLKAYSSVLLL